jgi:hypothetical protein
MYTYLVASLPAITLGEAPPQTPEDFLFHAQGLLNETDRKELQCIIEGRTHECESAFGRRWHNVSTQIRNTVARIRAGRLNVDARGFMRAHSEYNMAVDHAVTDAMNKTQPLERTMALDRCRWQALDELVDGDGFGFAALLAFAVKLGMMQRWARLDDKTGMDRVETFITENVDKTLELQRVGVS